MSTVAERLLYECIRELSYVQEMPGCGGLCASPVGKELIERGMSALQVRYLAEDTLDEEKLAEWNKAAGL